MDLNELMFFEEEFNYNEHIEHYNDMLDDFVKEWCGDPLYILKHKNMFSEINNINWKEEEE